MWHLLKTEWQTKKYTYLMPLIFPGLIFIYRVVQALDKWMLAPPINNIVAMITGFTFAVAVFNGIQHESERRANPIQLTSRIPIALWKLHTIRFLSGTTLYGSVLTLSCAIFFMLTHHNLGTLHKSILAFHGILAGSQILLLMLEDLTYTWQSKHLRMMGILFLPVGYLFIFIFLFFQKNMNYNFSLIELIILNVLPLLFMYASYYLFQNRKSYMR